MRIPKTLTLKQLVNATHYMIASKVLEQPPFPLVAKIELTRNCNAQCTMCKLPSLPTYPDITPQQLTHLLNQLPNTILITPFGFGESFMHPKALELLTMIQRRGKKISLTTNASLITEEKARTLMQLKPYLIIISIDAGEKEQYETIRKGLNYEQVKEDIKFLVYLRNTGIKTKLELSAVIGKHNQNQLLALVQLTEELGVHNIIFTGLDTHGTGNATTDNEADSTQVKAELSVLQSYYKNMKIRHTFNTPRKCLIPETELFIQANGNVYPCCKTLNWLMGNAHKEKISDIWNGTLYRQFRTLYKANQISECNKCRGIIHKPLTDTSKLAELGETGQL